MDDRKTSASKNIKLDGQERTSLDRHGVAVSHFEHARDPDVATQQEKLVERQKEDMGKEDLLKRDDAYKPVYYPQNNSASVQSKQELTDYQKKILEAHNERLKANEGRDNQQSNDREAER